jgi:hypothetical protein
MTFQSSIRVQHHWQGHRVIKTTEPQMLTGTFHFDTNIIQVLEQSCNIHQLIAFRINTTMTLVTAMNITTQLMDITTLLTRRIS